jgi:hypothetical protein
METETKQPETASATPEVGATVKAADPEKQARDKRIHEAVEEKAAIAENTEGVVFELPLAKCFICEEDIHYRDRDTHRYIIAVDGAEHPSEVCAFCASMHGYQEWPKWLPRLVVH